MATRSISRNAVLNFMGQGAPLLVGALTIPFTVRWLGPTRFGILSLVWVLIGYFNVFDLGLGRAITKFVADAAERDETEVPSLVGTAMGAQVALGLIGGIVVWVAAPPFVERVLTVPAGVVDEARGAFHIVALAVPVALASASLRATLEGAQRFDLVNAVRVPLGSLYFVVPLVGAAARLGLPVIVLSIFLLQLCGAVVQYRLCVRTFPGLRSLRLELRTLKRLLSFGGWVAVSGVVGPVLVYLDRFAIGVLLSVGAVGLYAAPYEVVTRLSIIPIGLSAALFPVFSAERVPEKVEALVSRSLYFLILTVGPLVLLAVALADDVVGIYLGAGFRDAPVSIALQILAIGVFANSLAYVPYSLLQASGRADVTAKFHLAELPLHFLVVWLLVDAFGLIGAAMAWSLRATLDAGLLFVAAGRLTPLSYRAISSSRVLSLGSGIAALAVPAFAISVLPSVWLRVGALLLAIGAAAALLTSEAMGRGWRDILPPVLSAFSLRR
ncbi:MAG: flippase [Actinomycetota bacterium]|nr:flippase [Actinomycetota bacterium]